MCTDQYPTSIHLPNFIPTRANVPACLIPYRSCSATLASFGLPNLEGKWYYAGPFDNADNAGFDAAYPPEKEVDLKATYTGKGGRKVGDAVYKYLDQGLIDGVAVNGSGKAARGTGGALRPLQSGKVNQYGALLFGAAAIGALVLVIVNI